MLKKRWNGARLTCYTLASKVLGISIHILGAAAWKGCMECTPETGGPDDATGDETKHVPKIVIEAGLETEARRLQVYLQ